MSLDTMPNFPQCINCAHLGAEQTCSAFGSRIPPEIWGNVADHRLAFDGDGGTRWEPRKPGLPHIRDIWREEYENSQGGDRDRSGALDKPG